MKNCSIEYWSIIDILKIIFIKKNSISDQVQNSVEKIDLSSDRLFLCTYQTSDFCKID